MRGYGGDVLTADGMKSTFSSPESLAGIQAYINLWTRQQIAVAPGQPGERSSCFTDQKCAVMFSVATGINFLQRRIGKQFDWDVQRMPAHPSGRYTGTLTYGFGIGKDSKHRELAWEFIKLLVDPSVQRTIALNRMGLPVLKSVAGDPTVMAGGPPANMQVFYQSADIQISPHAYPTRCGNLYTGMVQSTIDDAVRQAINGADVVDTFKQVDLKIQECLNSAQ
jgi:multiple sugar transport system substrate-binding protein